MNTDAVRSRVNPFCNMFRLNKHVLFSIVSYIFVLATCEINDPKKVQVSVYYESLCPDSKKFINTQLYPTLTNNSEALFKHVQLKLIPYGKATSQYSKSENEFKFICHHGEDECVGNRIHACGLHTIASGQIDGIYVARNALDFVNCLMQRVDKNATPIDFKTKECALVSHVTNIAHVENCANHVDGKKFLANFGTETDSLQPPLISVPTITFNGKYSPQESNEAYNNFARILCKYILRANNGEIITGCEATNVSSINMPLTFVVLISTILVTMKSLVN